MRTTTQKSSVLLTLAAGTVIAILAVIISVKALACPNVLLSSPPSSMAVYSGTCSGGIPCDRSSTTIFTLSNNSCPPYTWTFTNTSMSPNCQKVFTTVSGVSTLQVSIPGATGDAITLKITDVNNSSSPTYSLTGVQCH